MRHLIGVMATVLAACSIPEKQLSGPYDCSGQGPGTPASEQVTITGTVLDAFNTFNPLSGARVDAFLSKTNAPIPGQQTPTDGQGHFRKTTEPLQEYLRITPTTPPPPGAKNYFNTYYYPAMTVTHDLDLGEIVVYNGDVVDSIVTDLNISAPDMMNMGMLTVTVLNCFGEREPGATVTTSIPPGMGGDIYYLGSDRTPSRTAQVTDSTYATALIFNVPADTITINATTAKGLHLYPNVVDGRAGAVVEADIQP